MASPQIDFESLRRLSVEERLRLIEALWDTIAADDPDAAMPLTPELEAELDRRVADDEADPSSAIPWEQVRRDLLREK